MDYIFKMIIVRLVLGLSDVYIYIGKFFEEWNKVCIDELIKSYFFLCKYKRL